MTYAMIAFVVLIRFLLSLIAASLFERKGYGYGRFFLISFLLDPFTCFGLYLLMPRLRTRRTRGSKAGIALEGGEA